MLDLDHPQTPHIFAASRQVDLILEYCKRMTLSDAAGRRFMFEVIRPEFAALRWLNRERFGDAPEIATAVDRLEGQAEALARMRPIDAGLRDGPAGRCPACGSRPEAPSQYDPMGYCSPCLNTIMPGLRGVQSVEGGFGIDAI